MFSRGSTPTLWSAGISFPLERLFQLINTGFWSDSESEEKWNSTYPDIPYQLWNIDPTSGDDVVFTLQDV
jgi:hypothetical protein